MKEIIGSLAAILQVILESKWKVTATIVLAFFAFSGSLVWHERDVLIGVWIKKPVYVNVKEFDRIAPDAMKQLNATGAAVILYDMYRNERTIVYLRSRNGISHEYDNFKGQAVYPVTEGKRVNTTMVTARLMSNEALCDTLPATTKFGEYRAREKLNVLCFAPIMDDTRLVAVVVFGFENMPENPLVVLDTEKVIAQQVRTHE